MGKTRSEKLLKDKRVKDEINRHLWIESEKAGYDIGWDKGSEDWLENYSADWIKHHLKKRNRGSKKRKAKKIKKNK